MECDARYLLLEDVGPVSQVLVGCCCLNWRGSNCYIFEILYTGLNVIVAYSELI
jgi:hypothetical protein